MSVRNVPLAVLSAALVLAGSGVASAQAASDKRIPVTKERGGEVALSPRVDTVMVYRTDTVTVTRMGRIDTVMKTVTTVRYDTVRIETPAPPPPPVMVRFPSGMYFGLAAGLSGPAGSLFQANNFGGDAQVQLGWQKQHVPLGFRLDGNAVRFNQDAGYAGFGVHGRIVNVNGDLKLALPTHLLGISPRFGLYGIGGGTFSAFTHLPMDLEAGVPGGVGPTNTAAPSSSWQHEWGWNGGGGASLMWGHSEVFVEARVIQFKASNAQAARQVPIVLGMNWY
jgi:hypothetical protein